MYKYILFKKINKFGELGGLHVPWQSRVHNTWGCWRLCRWVQQSPFFHCGCEQRSSPKTPVTQGRSFHRWRLAESSSEIVQKHVKNLSLD